jgi:uncharacterized membrane protein
MRTLIESLKRLYDKGKITDEQLKERIAKGTITEEDFKKITGK